jgi:hypothetical protein
MDTAEEADPAGGRPDTPTLVRPRAPREGMETAVDLDAQRAGREQRPPDAPSSDEPISQRGHAEPYSVAELSQHIERSFRGVAPITEDTVTVQPGALFMSTHNRLFRRPPPPGTEGYVDPDTGHIYILASGRENFLLRFHEAVHAVSIRARHREPFRLACGQFLEEGITEFITQRELGEDMGTHPAYARNMQLIRRMQRRLGVQPELIEGAYLRGEMGALFDAIETGFGGGMQGERLRGEFLRALQPVGPDESGAAGVARAFEMLERAPAGAAAGGGGGTP